MKSNTEGLKVKVRCTPGRGKHQNRNSLRTISNFENENSGKKILSSVYGRERVNIFCHMYDSENSKKLMNKKSELTGKCSCNARFLRLYLKGVGGADEASSSCQKLA